MANHSVTRYLKCTLLQWTLSWTTAYVYSSSGHIDAVYCIHNYVHICEPGRLHSVVIARYTLTLHLCMTEELLSSPLICCSSGVPLRSHILYIDNGGTMWSSVKLDILKNQLCDMWHKRACAHTHLHMSAFHCSYIYTITGTLSVVPILYMSLEHSPTCRQHIHCAACCVHWVNSQLICMYNYVYYCVLSQHLHWVGLYKFCCPL